MLRLLLAAIASLSGNYYRAFRLNDVMIYSYMNWCKLCHSANEPITLPHMPHNWIFNEVIKVCSERHKK